MSETVADPVAGHVAVVNDRPPRAHARLRVQAGAKRTRQRHVVRALRRVVILGACDAAVIFAGHAFLVWLSGAPSAAKALVQAFPGGFAGWWGFFLAFPMGLALTGAYGSEERWASPSIVLRGVALGAALAAWQSIDTHGIAPAGLRWAVLCLVLGVGLLIARSVLASFVFHLGVRGTSDRVILVGDPTSLRGLEAARGVQKSKDMESLGWLSERASAADYLGHPSAVWEVLCESPTDTILLAGDLPHELFETVVEAAAVAGCRCLSVAPRGTLMASQPRALKRRDLRMLELTFPAARVGQDFMKRLFDLVSALGLLILLLPVLVLIGIWIKLDSRGPVYFVQDRVGRAGRVFSMVKFRTMVDGADSAKGKLAGMNSSGDPRLFKIPNDPRVTKAGAFLRRWSLDERPQLWNVVRGDMSLVGPRPFFEADLAAYDDHHFIRLSVKPGLTGLWQVRGRSSIVDFEEVIDLDREYIEDWSFWLDLKLLFLTLPAVLRRTGAY